MNRAYWMLIGSVFLWGLTVVPMKWTLDTVQPFTLMFLRLLLASLLLLPFAWARRRRSSEQSAPIPWLRIALLSFTGVAGYFWLHTFGIAMTSGVNASIISATLPLFTLLLAAAKAGIYLNAIPLFNVLPSILLLNERMSWRTVVGGLLVLAGVVWAERRKASAQPAAEENGPVRSERDSCSFCG